ncbi:MAG: hypothetical protein WB992_25865 [Bryobacteraceae bacterium]
MRLHYGYGAMIGILYTDFSCRMPQTRARFGMLFGALLWLIADEIPVSLSGVSNPLQQNAASHAGALAAHLLFGTTVERIMRGRE